MIDPVTAPIAVSSLQGMNSAETQLQAAAGKIAQLPAISDHPQTGDTVDLSAEMVAMLNARDNFMANVEAAKSGDEIQRALLNLIG